MGQSCLDLPLDQDAPLFCPILAIGMVNVPRCADRDVLALGAVPCPDAWGWYLVLMSHGMSCREVFGGGVKWRVKWEKKGDEAFGEKRIRKEEENGRRKKMKKGGEAEEKESEAEEEGHSGLNHPNLDGKKPSTKIFG